MERINPSTNTSVKPTKEESKKPLRSAINDSLFNIDSEESKTLLPKREQRPRIDSSSSDYVTDSFHPHKNATAKTPQ